jgi:phosphate transport system substrate-binding protein
MSKQFSFTRASTNATVILGILALIPMAACHSGPTKTNPANAAQSSNQIIGAGSSFIYPAMTQWVSNFEGGHPGVQINYQSIGSGGGIEQLKNGLVDFAASDASLSDEQLKSMPTVLQIPESAGPVCLTYNLPALKAPLRFSPDTLAHIYLGKIKTWQDPAIKKENPGVTLPNSAIVPVHRSDGSGTTNIFATYLSKVSSEWDKQVGKGISLNWPAGLGGKGNEGVTGVVKQTAGGIGYVELIYAKQNNLPVALIRNQAGNWTQPSASGTTAAIEAFSKQLDDDVRTPIVDPPASAKEAYPISGLTFLIVPKQAKSADKGKLVQQFLQYILAQGQDEAAKLDYAKLSPELTRRDQSLLAELQEQTNQASSAAPQR